MTGKVLDMSLSLVDNVEHIYVNEDLGIGAGLGPGEYALQVVAPTDDVSYALAWLTNMELVIGDMNLDGIFDFDDVDPFVLGLIDADTYLAIYGVTPNIHGDFDGDGRDDLIVGAGAKLSPGARLTRAVVWEDEVVREDLIASDGVFAAGRFHPILPTADSNSERGASQ